MDLRSVALGSLSIVFVRQLWVAGSTFKIIRSEGRRLEHLAIPASIMMVAWLSGSISPGVWTVAAGCGVAACSLVLLEWSRMSIRGQFFSYLFSHDVPGFLWTAGPYAYVRNPFYASYLLAYASAVIMVRSLAMILLFGGMFVFYSAAALKEERKFARSPLAAEYEAYKQRTGRFIPKLG